MSPRFMPSLQLPEDFWMKAASAVIAFGILWAVTGCVVHGPDQQTTSGAPQIETPADTDPTTPNNPERLDLGGGDLGGGNGLFGKPLESYRVRIETTSAFKTFITPVLDRIAARLPLAAVELNHIVQKRAWYFIPKELKALPSELIAVSFSSDQLALQTHKSVWIDNIAFAKMEPRDQALLYMHEMVMGLKILNFASYQDQCEARSLRDDNWACGIIERMSLPEGFLEFFMAQKLELTAKDYEAIRFVTGELFDGRTGTAADAFVTLLQPIRTYPTEAEVAYLEMQAGRPLDPGRYAESLAVKLRHAPSQQMFAAPGLVQRGKPATHTCVLNLSTDAVSGRVKVRLEQKALGGASAEKHHRVIEFAVAPDEVQLEADPIKFQVTARLGEDAPSPKEGDERFELKIAESMLGLKELSLYRVRWMPGDRNVDFKGQGQMEWVREPGFLATADGFETTGLTCRPTRSFYKEL